MLSQRLKELVESAWFVRLLALLPIPSVTILWLFVNFLPIVESLVPTTNFQSWSTASVAWVDRIARLNSVALLTALRCLPVFV
jgi:hypothetical protein